MFPLEHSAILLTFIRLAFVIKVFVLSSLCGCLRQFLLYFQSCGTMLSGGYLSKGCVKPDSCQTGCYGDTCTFCCQDDMCNQPWSDIIVGKMDNIMSFVKNL